MLVDGFSISGYRSFGKEIQYFAPLSKINLLIGKNNSGKSNVLRLIVHHLPAYIKLLNNRHGNLPKYSDIDEHKGNDKIPINLGIAIDLKSEKAIQKLENSDYNIKQFLARLFNSDFIKDSEGFLWLLFDTPTNDGKLELANSYIELLKSKKILNPDEWNQLCLRLTSNSTDLNSNIKNILITIARNLYPVPEIYFIPAIRSISDAQSNDIDLSGAGIIDKLARLQNPAYNNQLLKKNFEKVNHFLRTVIDNAEAQIEIPYERNQIIVHLDEKSLPLESLGTGIHEVIILAAAATLINNSIICIEEPEIHLHPILQKKLLIYLYENTSNQYFIATHSPHLLDSLNTSIFHIKHDGSSSYSNHITTNESIFEICSDLGYRPSDLLQTNSIIWVEGPSDRIYINHWLKHLDQNLIEGTHYSIMFYGGKLLNQFTINDEVITDFISLTRLNRNSLIIIDSDRKNKADQINETKQRIINEFTLNNKIAWLTSGREVENYINPDVYESVVLKIHPTAEKLVSKTLFSNLPQYIKKNTGEVTTADKIKVAKAIAKINADLKILDLESRMKAVLEFIKQANGIEI